MSTNSNSNYTEFPEPTSKSSSSPSLPWFVEYWWASSIASKPLHEMLFSCTSESSAVQQTMDTTVNDFSARLRRKVASHEEDESSDWMHHQRYNPAKGTAAAYPSIRKSSILYEEEYDDDDDESVALNKQHESILDKSMFVVEDDDNDDDDTRDGSAPASSFMEDASSRMLYTCESFDNFLRGKSGEESAVRLAPRVMLAQDDDDAMVSTTTRPSNSLVRQRLQPPPSPSATTYTTVSLTTSYMNDMDDSISDEEGDDPKAVLERWTQASHQLFRGMDVEVGEEAERDDIYSTPKQSRKRPSSSPPPCYKRKSVSPPYQDKTNEAYQYLIRMKPQNYVHDYSNGWEEEKKEDCEYNRYGFDLPSHLQLQSDMTFHEAFFQQPPPPSMPEF